MMSIEDKIRAYHYHVLRRKHPRVEDLDLREHARRLTQEEIDAYDPDEDEHRFVSQARQANVEN